MPADGTRSIVSRENIVVGLTALAVALIMYLIWDRIRVGQRAALVGAANLTVERGKGVRAAGNGELADRMDGAAVDALKLGDDAGWMVLGFVAGAVVAGGGAAALGAGPLGWIVLGLIGGLAGGGLAGWLAQREDEHNLAAVNVEADTYFTATPILVPGGV